LINKLLDRKRRGAIITVASTAGTFAFPYLQVYSGTKAFNDFFSRALSEEVPQLDIISLRPGYVSTQLTLRKRPAFDVLTPIEWVVLRIWGKAILRLIIGGMGYLGM